MKSPLFFCCTFLLILTSCGPSYVYEETRIVTNPDGWAYGEVMTFEFPVTDTSQLYDLHLLVEHDLDFGSQNTYVNIKTFFPNGQELEESVSLQLADKFGQWYGNCSGETCSLDIPIQQSAYFNETGNYRVEIEQYSRENPLAGIGGIGFALAEAGSRE